MPGAMILQNFSTHLPGQRVSHPTDLCLQQPWCENPKSHITEFVLRGNMFEEAATFYPDDIFILLKSLLLELLIGQTRFILFRY